MKKDSRFYLLNDYVLLADLTVLCWSDSEWVTKGKVLARGGNVKDDIECGDYAVFPYNKVYKLSDDSFAASLKNAICVEKGHQP